MLHCAAFEPAMSSLCLAFCTKHPKAELLQERSSWSLRVTARHKRLLLVRLQQPGLKVMLTLNHALPPSQILLPELLISAFQLLHALIIRLDEVSLGLQVLLDSLHAHAVDTAFGGLILEGLSLGGALPLDELPSLAGYQGGEAGFFDL